MAETFEPPMMTNGKTWADEPWWAGKASHEPPESPVTFDEAQALTWARCWAYIEAHELPPKVCHHLWPIVYGALNACHSAMKATTDAVEAVLAEPDDTQWWPARPYMDPHDEDEVVEVEVVNVSRVRDALTSRSG